MNLLSDLERLQAEATPGPWEDMFAHWGQAEIVTFQLAGKKAKGEIAGRGKYIQVTPYIDPKDAALIVALRNALPEIIEALRAGTGEPVAWMNPDPPSGVFSRFREGAENFGCRVPLYASPPTYAAGKADGLEEAAKEVEECFKFGVSPAEYARYVRALKEK